MQQEEVDEESERRMMENGLQVNSDSLMLEMTGNEVLGKGVRTSLSFHPPNLFIFSRKIILAELPLL